MTPTIACALTVAVGTPLLMATVGWLLQRIKRELFRLLDWRSRATAQINANVRTTMADFRSCNARFRFFDQHLADLDQAHREAKAAFERTLVDHSRFMLRLRVDHGWQLKRITARLDALDQYVQELPTFEDAHGITDSEREAMRANLVAAIRRAADDIERDGEFAPTEADLDPDFDLDTSDDELTGDDALIDAESSTAEIVISPALLKLAADHNAMADAAQLARDVRGLPITVTTRPLVEWLTPIPIDDVVQGFLVRNGHWIDLARANPAAADPLIIPFVSKYRQPTE